MVFSWEDREVKIELWKILGYCSLNQLISKFHFSIINNIKAEAYWQIIAKQSKNKNSVFSYVYQFFLYLGNYGTVNVSSNQTISHFL